MSDDVDSEPLEPPSRWKILTTIDQEIHQAAYEDLVKRPRAAS